MSSGVAPSTDLDLLRTPLHRLMDEAAGLRDAGFAERVTYSKKVFVPLTKLCRDICHYCTFARAPRELTRPYMSLEEVVAIAEAGNAQGCNEVLFTLGDKPEVRYPAARRALAEMGYSTTIDYLRAAAAAVVERTGMLPHLNAGIFSAEDYRSLRSVSVSMGIMLESAAERLCERGGPHFGSPDKHPSLRLASLDLAGHCRVPLTTGLLVGIGETRVERLYSLRALLELHRRHGHIQELIIQNFLPKADTRMAAFSPPQLEELLWTIAVTRLLFGSAMSIQSPPNLNTGRLASLLSAGINDWGGVSPVTLDHVNPEAPWPELENLKSATADAGKVLVQRLPVLPDYIAARHEWIDPSLHRLVLERSDSTGLARDDDWAAGGTKVPPSRHTGSGRAPGLALSKGTRIVAHALARADRGQTLRRREIVAMFESRGPVSEEILCAADTLRERVNGPVVTYVVNRNINYTNMCTFRCRFCAFARGRRNESLRGAAYQLSLDEIARRAVEARDRGATEVCLQGGIHPAFTGETYLAIARAVHEAAPELNIHAFSPLEVSHGAHTLGLSISDFLWRLRDVGLTSLPGTAAEVLDDRVRRIICPDKLDSRAWLSVLKSAHDIGLPTSSTLMFGHVETPDSWALHLLALRKLQSRTGGITEFVPLPFVHMGAPLYRDGNARPGPTFREALLVHAVARLALHPLIENIQASWTKLGEEGAAQALAAGANDLGGTLMNESISRAAGASHGQELGPERMEAIAFELGREPRQRTTTYDSVDPIVRCRAWAAMPLSPIVQTPARRSADITCELTVNAGESP
jgi:FO synthase